MFLDDYLYLNPAPRKLHRTVQRSFLQGRSISLPTKKSFFKESISVHRVKDRIVQAHRTCAERITSMVRKMTGPTKYKI